jgi:hypothetical protein
MQAITYRQFRKTLSDTNYKLIPSTVDPLELIDEDSKDYYVSVYDYNQSQYEMFLRNKTVKGIKEVTTSRLIWDFDSENDVEKAKQETIVLVDRLIGYGVSPASIEITFSGKKGFGVEVKTTDVFSVEKFRNITQALAADLETFDELISDPNRIIRLTGTKHHKTGLYKIPLTRQQLDLSVDSIRRMAQDLDGVEELIARPQKLPDVIKNIKHETKKVKPVNELGDIDFTTKPKFLTSCRFAIQNGAFKQGQRSVALLCLASTYKNIGFDIEHTYRLLKGVAELQAKRNNDERFPDEEIYNNICLQVYSPSWNNGQYTCREAGNFLHGYCESLGVNKCSHNNHQEDYVEVENVFSTFQNYAENIEKNTVVTGIHSLDKNIRFRVGQMVGILGAPSSGKTSLALNILENTSRQGLHSVFYSLDMADSELFQKLVHKVTGYNEDRIYNIFKNNLPEKADILDKVKQAFGNVKFCFNTGVSVENISEAIDDYEKETNNKIKLVLIDYNELIAGPYSDATANSGHIAGQLKKLTNSAGVCTVVLLQPAKVWGDASDEINTYRATKGSSLLEQCFSIIMGIYRPGFSARNDSADDRFLVLNTLKNRMGKLFNLPFRWNGTKGEISELEQGDRGMLEELIERKKLEKADKSNGFG